MIISSQASGDYEPSFGAHIVAPPDQHNLNNDEAAWLAGIIL